MTLLELLRSEADGDTDGETEDQVNRSSRALLFATATSGLLLAAARHTPALALLLSAHLASVMALFLIMPYGKFVHGIYRLAALLAWSLEKRTPSPIDPGEA